MAKYSNRRVNVEAGVEPSRGGGPGATTIKYLFPKVSLTVKDIAPKIKLNASLGDNAMNRGELLEDQWAEGSFEGEVRNASFGLVLLNALGTVSSASFNSVYKHTYTYQNDNATDSIYLKVFDPDRSLLYRNVMITNLQIRVVLGDVVKFSCDWIGKKSVTTTSTQPTRITEYNFTKNHLSLKIADLTSNLDAATRLGIKDLTLTIDKGTIEKDQSFGSAEPEDFLNSAGTMIKGEFMLNYEDDTIKNYMKNNTMRAMRIDLVNSDVTIGSTNPAIRFDFTDVYFENWEDDPALDEIRKQKVQFEAHWDEQNQQFFDDAYIVNGDSAYA